ncbi:MAG: 2,3-bisphosphoglycerate-independent phosphoglycerate mutase [Promethearchaeota archaeon]
MERAIILVAGFGSRLKPLTIEEPKCLTEVNGVSILLTNLTSLEKNGVKEAIIVVGYKKERIIEKIGNKFNNMSIKYISNDIYDKTNSMYSLWLAREYLEKGSIIIEGDCVYENKLVENIINSDKSKSFWGCSLFTEELDGSMETVDQSMRIIDINIVREKLPVYKKNYFKSAGILKVTKQYGIKFSKWLTEDVNNNNVKIYYDLVLSKHLTKEELYVYDVSSCKWGEIDDLEDLHKVELLFTNMKYVIVLGDGVADMPIQSLNNKTPVEYAKTPILDNITKNGKTGLLKTSFNSLPVGSIVANLGILGFNPLRYYPNGRSSFEALAQDIFLENTDIVFRCNLVSFKNEIITDFTSKMIKNKDALKIIDNIEIIDKDIDLYGGQSYRNLLVLKNSGCKASDFIAKAPHMNIGKNINFCLIEGKTEKAKKIVIKLNKLMLDSINQIKQLNIKHKTSANMLWLWSPSSTPNLPSFYIRNKIHGAVVAGLDFMKGIAFAANMQTREIKGATGFIDTNLDEKVKYAKNFLQNNDLVFIHINAPDEEAHNHSELGKVKAIELIESKILLPLFKYLEDTYPNNYRICFLPDHYTFCSDGKHGSEPVPYVIYGKNIVEDSVSSFSEKLISNAAKNVLNSYNFLDFLINK